MESKSSGKCLDGIIRAASDLIYVEYERGVKYGRSQKWISVKDGLPDKEGEVLAALFGRVYMCWYLAATKQFEGPSGIIWDIDVVTHWMPLPEPPKED